MEKYIIYNECGTIKGTCLSNYNSFIEDARKTNTYKDFTSPEAVRDYLIKYCGGEKSDYIIVKE